MLAEVLDALAAAGSTALVTAMVTDGWEGLRARFAHLLGRGAAEASEIAAARLEQSRMALAALSGAKLERVRADQEIVWRTRLVDLLEREPGAEEELRALVANVQARMTGPGCRVDQHAVASGQAQQVIQGQGVQNVSFGGQRGSGSGEQ